MPKPTRAEMAALVERLRKQYSVPPRAEDDWRWLIADRNEAADALEALMQERAASVAIDESDSMIRRNPAPDASAPMVPSESRTFTIGAAPPAKPARELPPQIEQALEESMRWHNGHQYRFSNNEEARKVWADHHESLTDALRAIQEAK